MNTRGTEWAGTFKMGVTGNSVLCLQGEARVQNAGNVTVVKQETRAKEIGIVPSTNVKDQHNTGE